jgi:hypothetical protein
MKFYNVELILRAWGYLGNAHHQYSARCGARTDISEQGVRQLGYST